MRMYDLIIKKRNGYQLTKEEIEYVIENYTKESIPDYQVSALLMAIYFKGMDSRETKDLTMAMANSGDRIDLSSIEGIKVDKHSTGGVGDTTTLVLGPMVAALGIPVAKMSGRGLGHTGGTIDKLESFKGFSVELSNEQFIDNVNRMKLAVVGQTKNLAPADKKLYALRDVTGTVDNISLIASSIMSKKIAAGADGIVLDVKVGSGAFMKTTEDAFELAKAMVEIGRNVGRKTTAVISDMDQPLGFAIGNSLEVIEAITTLKGQGPKDLLELCLTIGSNMVLLAKKASSEAEARKLLEDTISSGRAIAKLKEFVGAQGGDITFIDDIDKFPKAKFIMPVYSDYEGVVKKIKAQEVGIIAMELGAGRITKESSLDLSVGIVLRKKRGESVKAGEILAYVHANDETKAFSAVEKMKRSYEIVQKYDESIPLIYGVVD
jgi:pyrimidine-nucleoside phosphorylase